MTDMNHCDEETIAARLDRLRDLAKFCGVDQHDRSGAGEALAAYFTGDTPVRQWASVVSSGEDRTILADHHTQAEAIAEALSHVADSISTETPLAVVDLDTGDTLAPDWASMPWKN